MRLSRPRLFIAGLLCLVAGTSLSAFSLRSAWQGRISSDAMGFLQGFLVGVGLGLLIFSLRSGRPGRAIQGGPDACA